MRREEDSGCLKEQELSSMFRNCKQKDVADFNACHKALWGAAK
jgi:hypothetical protein